VSIPKETRYEIYENMKPSLRERQRSVLAILWQRGDMTEQEVADTLCFLRVTPTNERNFATPSLTELSDKGLVMAVGKKICKNTGRTVTVWSAVDTGKKNASKQEQIDLSMRTWLDSLERGGNARHTAAFYEF
jgi:predicted ArsR family transcriptional regulator